VLVFPIYMPQKATSYISLQTVSGDDAQPHERQQLQVRPEKQLQIRPTPM